MSDAPKPQEAAESGLAQPRLVRRVFWPDDMPADIDHNEAAKTAIGRIQMEHIMDYNACFCADCRKQTRVTMAYKCRWCGVWYCHQCAAKHFGPESPANNAERMHHHP